MVCPGLDKVSDRPGASRCQPEMTIPPEVHRVQRVDGTGVAGKPPPKKKKTRNTVVRNKSSEMETEDEERPKKGPRVLGSRVHRSLILAFVDRRLGSDLLTEACRDIHMFPGFLRRNASLGPRKEPGPRDRMRGRGTWCPTR